jgi:tRNA (guanine10-N2)-dimethyltransferase
VKLLLEPSMECESLSRSEATAAAEAIGTKAKALDHEPGVLVLQTDADPVALGSRLGLCHFVSEWFFSCSPNELESCVEGLDVEGPIRVRSTKIGDLKIDLAAVSRRVGGIVGRSRGVDLRNPRTDLRIVFSKRVHVGRVLAGIDRSSFEKRKNRYMPFLFPASLHPKYARALVNLSRVREDGSLLDPFCGTGAILAEAALVGLDAIGSDISTKMIEGARKNLSHLGLDADLHPCDVGDIGKVVGSVSGIATDPPYGKSTSTGGESIQALYSRAFDAFSKVLGRGATVAIVVPKVSLLENVKAFQLIEEHGLWVHRSLTRHFCVLKRN